MEQNIISICEKLSKTAANEAVNFDDLIHFKKELTNSDMPTSVKFNRYDNEITTAGGQSDIRGIDKNITSNIDKLKFYIFKDNIEMVNYPSTLLIHLVLNRNDFNVSNVKQIDITIPMKKISVSSASGGQGIGRLNDDVVFTQIRSNLFVGDIIHFFYSLSKKTVFILVERGVAYREKILPRLKSIFENLDSGVMHTDNILFETGKMTESKHNIIYYGVPGVGKSYKINEVKGQYNQERTVFHPEYTNSDFVGQLIPKRDENNEGHISYVFENGPFTRVLINALKDKNKDNQYNQYMLVVEEINRGNAAAIFGEIFQLLDRDENGKSKYAIENKTIVEAIRKEYPDYDKDYEEILKSYKPTFNKDNDYLVFIPENLYIWATMNTSDQNVYTLDTAFQRRWAMEMISINFDKDATSKEHGNLIINGSNNLTWREFVEKINSIMEIKKVDMVSTEDKRLGTFFATKLEICDRKLFIQKVIKYLWDDAFKLEKSEGEIFNIKKYPSLDKIVESDANIEDFFMPSLFGDRDVTESENVNNEQES